MIKKVHRESSMNITTMTEKDWSRLSTEDYITMEYNMQTDLKEFQKCKPEIENPDTDWPVSWSLCRYCLLFMDTSPEYSTNTREAL